eukprot:CAMPEP_0119033654 /NCGR_PEP_ID=MMETSP1177-20130426/703_1 /TAXON_ID=2985 /ORGANISM="Ochromonas sp, Strain CCMP1899" /LENGTH=232 /DNA_ID=CAMNT_0006990561 /DNA_START=23 /DNA_END=721 /DNA_ORIENTATION=+
MIRATLVLACIGSALSFTAPKSVQSSLALNAKSKSVPFLDQPVKLTGNMAGDVGFDPLGFTEMWADKDWSEQVVPTQFKVQFERTPVTTIEWMREAELKHGRLSMLAVVGWIAVDSGLRLPFSNFQFIENSFVAHNEGVQNGSMGLLLFAVFILELVSGVAIFDQSKGSGRIPGDFNFDPLNLSVSDVKRARFASNEIKNGRLAMLAISGILTQQAVFPDQTFPFIANLPSF